MSDSLYRKLANHCHWIHLCSSLHLNLVPFPRLIESSLGSVATKLNFFIHNLAQMKFASSEERPVLSFAPRVYTLKSDGVIRSLFVCRHIKTFTPSKGYVSLLHLNLAQNLYIIYTDLNIYAFMQSYVVKVEREGQPGSTTLVQRTFEEFHELHSKLQLIFPSSKLPRYNTKTWQKCKLYEIKSSLNTPYTLTLNDLKNYWL